MKNIVLANAIINEIFKNDIKLVENLDGHETYLQDDGEIAVMIYLFDEDITKDLIETMQFGCELTYFTYGQKKVNMYILAKNCRMRVNEYEIPSKAVFTIKMATAQ